MTRSRSRGSLHRNGEGRLLMPQDTLGRELDAAMADEDVTNNSQNSLSGVSWSQVS
jgi:hypothetical protein